MFVSIRSTFAIASLCVIAMFYGCLISNTLITSSIIVIVVLHYVF